MLTLVRICRLQAFRPQTFALPSSQNLPLLIEGSRWRSGKRLVVFPFNAKSDQPFVTKELCLLKASTGRCATPKPVVFLSTATDFLSYLSSVSWKGAWKLRRKQLRRKPRSKNIRNRRRPMTSHSKMHMGPMRKPWTQTYVEYWLYKSHFWHINSEWIVTVSSYLSVFNAAILQDSFTSHSSLEGNSWRPIPSQIQRGLVAFRVHRPI